MKVSEFVAQVRDVLSGHWTQGRYKNEHTGDVCILSGCERVTLYNIAEQDIVPTAARAVKAINKKTHEMHNVSIIPFNDDDDTNHQDVLNLLDKTVIGLEERGE